LARWLNALLPCSYPASRISILTTYNGQKALIRDLVQARCMSDPALFGEPAKISTVDKFQGSQNDCLLDLGTVVKFLPRGGKEGEWWRGRVLSLTKACCVTATSKCSYATTEDEQHAFDPCLCHAQTFYCRSFAQNALAISAISAALSSPSLVRASVCPLTRAAKYPHGGISPRGHIPTGAFARNPAT